MQTCLDSSTFVVLTLYMVIFHSSIFYFDFKAFFNATWSNLKRFKLSLVLTTIIVTIVFGLLNFTIVLFRLLDEVLFFGYRKTKIVKPVFIISNPRSGTTFLHRLMTLDEDRFAYFLLYHTLGNSILFNKLINFGGRIDQKIGRPMRKFFDWTEGVFFKGWKNIHPMGWNESEEDEAPFVFGFSSPAIAMIYPFMKTYDWVNFPDDYPPAKAKKLKNFYKNSIQRFVYSEGRGKTFLSKNVLSTGRIKLILEVFPDAQIIYPVRHPYQAIPSFISMFSKPWKTLYKFIPEDSAVYRQWGDLAIKYYQYFYEIAKELSEEQFYTVSYDNIILDAENVVNQIYFHFGMNKSPEFDHLLKEKSQRSKSYKSTHAYSLEMYGFSKKEVLEQLKPVFEKYGFKP